MNKPTKTFKMDKTTKSFLAFLVDKSERDSFRRAMIDAQLESVKVIQKKETNQK